ncbi:MAG: DNA polymerase III subunit alpha [Bacteroidales bacterium]|nr:DNA polymerase III subunit alpha [Bacteroidales bacterium]
MYLNCHSYYSLRYGTAAVETLVEKAAELGIGSMALTDINNSTGMVDFVRCCNEKGIDPVAGIEFRDGDHYLYTGIARNGNGFRELNEFLSYHNEVKLPFPATAPHASDAWFIYDFDRVPDRRLRSNELIGIGPSQLNRLYSSPWRDDHSRLVIFQPVVMLGKNEHELHRYLRAVDQNIVLGKLKPQMMAAESDILLPPDLLRCAYEDFPEIVRNTDRLMSDCSISFDFSAVKNKRTYTGSRSDDRILLEKLALEGMEYRYGKHNRQALQRISHELQVIDKLGFSSYFLVTWDVIRYSLSRGFYHVGRGSGANSIVAYCLRITDVDPIDLDLYFERFINPRRSSPPDFDIDFSWKERDDVLDYIFKRYGRRHTALIGTISTFRDRSIFREFGKVSGLAKEEIDLLVRDPEDPMNDNPVVSQIYRLGNQVMDFPNLRSIHAGGVIVSEEPITRYVALDMPPKGLPTTQWDMYVAENIGYEKLDILSQRGIGHIKDAAEIVRKNRGVSVDVHRVEQFKTDEKVLEQLRTGETNGCFYIESPAMRGLLKKLRCSSYKGLVAASSIIRPGVAKSGMMREYIHRFHHPEQIRYLHPVMEELLAETFGVMVYQEDVIRVCHHFAGLDLADADVLRRAMSGKYRSRKEFDRIAARFFSNCRQKGYPDKLTNEVWRQISSFAGYSFSKAHSASFAVESFQSLYLKAHFPLEFQVAVINNFGGFYRTWVYVNEARRKGAKIHLPCINRSEYHTSINGIDVFLGLVHLQNLERGFSSIFLKERELNGEYSSLENFVSRVAVKHEQLVILIRADAFRFTGKTKKELLWETQLITKAKKQYETSGQMFRVAEKKYNLPELIQSEIEDAYDEIELLGFSVTMDMFGLLKTRFRGEIMACDMPEHVGKKKRMVGRLVTTKYVRTVKNEIMQFGTFLDAKGEFFDVVNFPGSLRKYPYKGSGIYLLLGEITEELGFPGMTVEKMEKLPLKPDPRY